MYGYVCILLPQKETPTVCCSLCSGVEGTLKEIPSIVPTEVPTQRLGDAATSLFLDRESQKCKEEMTSRDSLSILVMLELRERLKELSLASVSMAIS